MGKDTIRPQDLETLNVGANTYVIGVDTKNNKTGLVAVSNFTGKTPWFGRRWRKGYASSVGGAVGDLDLGRVFANTIGLGGYLVKNDHTREKLSAATHYQKENGATAVLDGSVGHYQWGWNTPLYYQVYEDADYMYETFSLGGPRPGYWNQYIPVGSRSCAGYAQMDRTNNILMSSVNSTAQYRGCENDASNDDTDKSGLCKPATGLTIQTLRDAARRNGTLWFANERCMQYVTAALKRVIFGDRNVQASYNSSLDSNGLRQGGTGVGVDLPNDWSSHFGYRPYIRLDVGIEKGDVTGLLSTTIAEAGVSKTINNIPSFYGLKNDYKYLLCMSENMLLLNNEDGSQSLFIDDNINGTKMNLSSLTGLKQIATGPAASSASWCYSKTYTLKNLSFFPGTELGASTDTFYCDGYYNSGEKGGLRGVRLLGIAYNGGNAGSLFVYGNFGVGAASVDWGAFLCEYAEAFTSQPFWCTED